MGIIKFILGIIGGILGLIFGIIFVAALLIIGIPYLTAVKL